ncbi:hypothetical protein AB0I81_12955 [Nonomuraea sp. NPDC050404]|uniref:hypothetical protein n=1 Tax=Nonomuraea sp. NPDC050404 TaxID=3155783 RepID=UPI0033E98299
MASLRIVIAAVATAGALAVAGVLVLRSGEAAEPARERLVVAAASTGPSVLVGAGGAVLEEFTGDCAGRRHVYLCERVRAELRQVDDTWLTKAGLTIRTAIDPVAQRAAQEAIDRHVGRDDPHVAAQAMIVPATGEIRALATSRGNAPNLQQGGTAMVYPLAAALEQGLRFDDGFPYAAAYRAPKYSTFKNCKRENIADPAHTVTNPESEPRDFTTLRSGTLATEETFFMKLTERVGLCESVTMAKRLGLVRGDGLPLREFSTFALGINEVDPIAVAGTYATLAARGLRCAPRVVTEVRADGGFARALPARCEQVLDAQVADAVTDVLATALAKSPLKGLGRDAAGMDGTADSYTTATYAGYTPVLASAVGLGHPGSAQSNKLSDVTIGGKRYEHVRGTTIPGPIWKDSMKAALDGTEDTSFTPPDTTRFGGCSQACAN